MPLGRAGGRGGRGWWRVLASNNRLRLMLTLELAVMLPAAALIGVNFYHLKSLRRDKALEAAIHRDFQQMLAISEKQLNLKAYKLAEDARDHYPAIDMADEVKARWLDDLLVQRPWLAHAFLYDPKHGLVFRSQPARMKDALALGEHERLSKLIGGWLAFEGKVMLEGMRKRTRGMTWSANQVKRPGGSKYMTTAFFAMPHVPKGVMAVGGVSLDPDYLAATILPGMLDELIAYKLGEEGGTPLAMTVYPAESEGTWGTSAAPGASRADALAVSSGWRDGKPEVSRNLDDVFRGLALGIKFQGTSVEALGRNWVYRSFLILAVLSVLLAGGLILTYRSVSKEVALARLKSDFVSNVSHELRTPLSLIRLYAETLELGRVTERGKVEGYYRIIRQESERLTALINNILDFSRIEAGRKEYDFRPTDLAELVSDTLDTYRGQIDEQGFAFQQDIDRGLPPVKVDREAIARSLVNLINNALKYSDREKFIGVRLYQTDGALKLSVADRGIGIARNEQAKIFEKFYRAGDPLVHNTKGSGLGLSLVRHIAHAHGGEVEVESTPGEGSTFTLSLPIAAAETPSATHDAA